MRGGFLPVCVNNCGNVFVVDAASLLTNPTHILVICNEFRVSIFVVDWCKRRWTQKSIRVVLMRAWRNPSPTHFDFVLESYSGFGTVLA